MQAMSVSTPVSSSRKEVLTDTTPPTNSDNGLEFRELMGQMALMFPKLPPKLQEQARQAHSHVQTLIRNNQQAEAVNLMKHMREMMAHIVTDDSSSPQLRPDSEKSLPFPPPSKSGVARNEESETVPAIPPLPENSSPEMVALRRSMEDLQMQMQESAAVTAIAKRVRDMELDQRYASLNMQVKEMKASITNRLETVRRLTEEAEMLARREVRKRAVSRNPFCEHGPTGYCEFCVGKDFEDDDVMTVPQAVFLSDHPPPAAGAGAENAINHEAIRAMQNTLKSYQTTLKELLEERKRELAERKRKEGSVTA